MTPSIGTTTTTSSDFKDLSNNQCRFPDRRQPWAANSLFFVFYLFITRRKQIASIKVKQIGRSFPMTANANPHIFCKGHSFSRIFINLRLIVVHGILYLVSLRINRKSIKFHVKQRIKTLYYELFYWCLWR